MKTWDYYRQGYLIHARGGLTPESREEADAAFRNYSRGCEEHLGITACTIATHLAVVEADFQIDFLGPVPETKASWVERLNLRVVEPVRRRRVCHSPEKAIFRGYLLELFVEANKDSIIATLDSQPEARTLDPDLYDTREQQPKMLGKGEAYTLTANEAKWVEQYVQLNHDRGFRIEVDAEAMLFKRALFRTELHSKQYTGVKTRRSHDVAIKYEEGVYFGVVEKFFRFNAGPLVLRLALVTAYPHRRAELAVGVERVNRNQPFARGRIVSVDSIEEKVIFVGGMNPCSVLRIPRSQSHA